MPDLLLANALIKLATKSDTLKMELKDVEKELGRSVTSMESHFVKGFKTGVDDAGSAVEMLGARFGSMAAIVSSSTAMMTGGLAALGVGLAKSISLAQDFEAEFANVSTLWASTPEDIRKMKDEVLALNPALGDSTELAKGLYEALSAGVEPAKGVQFVADAAMLARAGLASTKEVVDVLTTTINAYGLQAQEAGRISDIMYKTVEQGKVIIPELAQNLGTVIPFAANLGVSFEELGAAMATLTKGGLNASESATALRGVFSNLVQESEKFKAEGIDIIKVLQEEGLAGAFKALNQVSKGNIEIVRTLIPDVRALTAVLALGGKQADEFAKQIGIMNNAGGATATAFRKQMDSLKGDMTTLWNGVKQIGVSVGETFIPALRGGTKTLIAMVEGMKLAAKHAKTLWDIVSGGKAAFLMKPLEEQIKIVADEMGVASQDIQETVAAGQKEIAQTAQLSAEQRKQKLESLETLSKARQEDLKVAQEIATKEISSSKAVAEANRASALELIQYDKALVLARLKGSEDSKRQRMADIKEELKVITGSGIEEVTKRKELNAELQRLTIQGLLDRAEAEAQITAILARENQLRMQLEDQYFQFRKSIGRVGVPEEIERLQAIAASEKRSVEERLQANQQAFTMAKQWSEAMFQHRRTMNQASLVDEIKYWDNIARTAQASSMEQIKAAENVYRAQKELADKRRAEARTLTEEAAARLEERGVTEFSQSDLERAMQEINQERVKRIQETRGKLTAGQLVTKEDILAGIEASEQLEQRARNFQELGGSFEQIFAGALTPIIKISDALEKIGLSSAYQKLLNTTGFFTPDEQSLKTVDTLKNAWSAGLSEMEATSEMTIQRILSKIETGASALSQRLLDKFRKEFPGMLQAELERS